MSRPASPSYLSVAHHGCRSYLEAYEAREITPNDPLADGLDFHRIAEGIQRAVKAGADPDATIASALDERGATTEVRAFIYRWAAAGWLDMSANVGAELGLAIDKAGELVPFADKGRAYLRGILDRLDVRDDPDMEMRLLEVVDWKGWGGFKHTQAETYALLALTWARAEGLDVDGVRVSSYSYRPTGGEVFVWTWDDLEYLRAKLDDEIRAAEALRARPAHETRPSTGCALCPRVLYCEDLKAVIASPVPAIPTSYEEAKAIAERMGAAEAFVKACKEAVGPYVKAHGPVPGGDKAWGPHESVKRSIHGPAMWADILDHVAPLLGDGANIDDLGDRLAQLVTPAHGAAKQTAKQIDSDRDGSEALLDAWTREGLAEKIGWIKG